MNNIEKMESLPKKSTQGVLSVLQIPLKITVQEGSFLHIGGSPSPLTEKKAPVFSVDGKPAIPASSFKGAFRYQVEQLLLKQKNSLKEKFKISDDNLLKPCIPAPRPSHAEKKLFKSGYRSHCEIKVDEDRIEIPKEKENDTPIGVCPVCYFFGATGLMGFLRIPNFWPEEGEFRIDQTSIRIDRESGTAATGAIVTAEQVKPGTIFKGAMEIILQQNTLQFGKAREIGETKVDLWLDGIASKPLEESQLLLINEILIPALNNVTILGGQKSKGAGKILIELDTQKG
ncbi:RAMP superfamily CRISPR-associated protein [Rosettibacter firmus]|uniref:RAMP superfamily CRISPR-associated protein n=1 Tax=Rosettibacter firmus TaxID=3111522 RepID=UPI00336BE615